MPSLSACLPVGCSPCLGFWYSGKEWYKTLVCCVQHMISVLCRQIVLTWCSSSKLLSPNSFCYLFQKLQWPLSISSQIISGKSTRIPSKKEESESLDYCTYSQRNTSVGSTKHPLAPSSTSKPLIIDDSSKDWFHRHYMISSLPCVTLRLSLHISWETNSQPSLLNCITGTFFLS